MKKELSIISISMLCVVILIGFGRWHWNQTTDEERKEIEDYNESNPHSYSTDAQTRSIERTITDMKIDFAVVFEQSYDVYESSTNRLLIEAEQKQLENIMAGKSDNHQLIKLYQSKFLDLEESWADTFLNEYRNLQNELEAAGYYRDDALEYELEFELRREQTTHTFLQSLMMIGNQIEGQHE